MLMKIFEIIPQNLFSILASKNKEIYAQALLALRKAFKQEMSVSKSDLAAMLIASMDEVMMEIDYTEEAVAQEEEPLREGKAGNSLSSAAHFIIRRLRETGWLEIEYAVDTFEENITLPDYTVKLINLLYSFTDVSAREYNSYVYAVYSSLKLADQERDEFTYTALVNAHDKTLQLIDELKTLHNNIRRYHQGLNEHASVNELLKGHFDEYRTLIVERTYHPLKTLDSVPRFKTPILKILGGWLADYDLREKMCEQALLRGRFTKREEAAEDIILKIGEIMDIYEHLDGMLEEIDRKNSAYTRASIEKMRYLLTSDRSIKGKIVELLTLIATAEEKRSGELTQRMAAAVSVYAQGYLDGKSLSPGSSRARREEEPPLEARAEEEVNGEALASFLERAKKSFSHGRVMDFMKTGFGTMDIITSEEIPLKDDETFILLLLASLKGQDKNVFYQAEYREGYVNNNGYRIPRITYIRKDHKHVG